MSDFAALEQALADAQTAYNAAANHTRRVQLAAGNYGNEVPAELSEAWRAETRAHEARSNAEHNLREARWRAANQEYQSARAVSRGDWQAVAKLADRISTGIGGHRGWYDRLDEVIAMAKASSQVTHEKHVQVRRWEL